MKSNFTIKKGLFISKTIRNLISLLGKKKCLIEKFALQLEELPVYITFHKLSEDVCILTVKDVGGDKTRIIRVYLQDSITSLLFLFTLIRDEYNAKTLFTNKSMLI